MIPLRFFIYVPGMPFDPSTIHTKSLGGSETAGYYLARALAKMGHEVSLFTNTDRQHFDDAGVVYFPIGPQSEKFRFGEHFTNLSKAVPHDVLIAQRVPGIFEQPSASAIRLWWTHDLAQGRFANNVKAGLWNCHGILAVSKWHAKQVAETVGLPPEYVSVVNNGIDLSLFPKIAAQDKIDGKVMVYTSRPERGLHHLVQPGGIMARLVEVAPEVSLLVCTYDHVVPEMQAQYEQLKQWGRALPNVTFLDPQAKKPLAAMMAAAWLHVYPVIPPGQFEEVSCISAMEAQAGGTPCIVPAWGALPETLEGGGAFWTTPDEGMPDKSLALIANTTEAILKLRKNPDAWMRLHEKALAKAPSYSWEKSAAQVTAMVGAIQRQAVRRPARLTQHLLYRSDYLAFKALCANVKPEDMTPWARAELPRYTGAMTDAQGVYDESAAYNDRINNMHNLGNDAAVLAMHRYRHMEQYLAASLPGAKVLDYACGVGMGTVAWARKFPDLIFTGCDIAALSVKKGQDYAEANAIPNVKFRVTDWPDKVEGEFDLVIASEILEHVPDPAALANALDAKCAKDGRVVLSVPMGAMEAVRKDEIPWREHVSIFDNHDIAEMFKGKPQFQFTHFQWGDVAPENDPVGGTVLTWIKGGEPVKSPDYKARLDYLVPREQVTLCVISRWDADDLGKMLRSALPYVDESVIGIDDKNNPAPGTGPAWDSAKRLGASTFLLSASPLDQGFDAARNETVEKARTEWILWLDADEELCHGERLTKYLKPGPYEAFCVPQHHLSTEPVGNLKTDLPCRLFRADSGLRFYGVVHEHPCHSASQPPKYAFMVQDFWISHPGYLTEEIRRKRFQRNIPLMVRDREKYPDRALGRMLWVRDLMHIAQFEMEHMGRTSRVLQHSEQALMEFRQLLQKKDMYLLMEGLPYASKAAEILVGPNAIRVRQAFDAQLAGMVGLGPLPPPGGIEGLFATREDAEAFQAAFVEMQMAPLKARYW